MLDTTEVQDYLARRQPDGTALKLHRAQVQKLLGELYLHVVERGKKKIKPILEESHRVGLPLLAINPDFVKIKVRRRKCLSIRLQGIDDDLGIVSQLVAIREYNPAREMEEQEKAGLRIGYFSQLYLSDFGVQLSDLIGGCSDSGTDIKNFVATVLKSHSPESAREWCLAHAWNVFVAAGLGAKNMDGRNQNPDFAEAWADVKELFAKVAQSPELQSFLLDKMEKMYGKDGVVAPTLGLDHRWLGHVVGLRALLSKWPAWGAVFKDYYCSSTNATYVDLWNAVVPHFQVLVETLAVLEPIHALVTEVQGLKQVVGAHALYQTLDLRLTLLSCNPAQEITVKQYSQSEAREPTVVAMTYASLQQKTQHTIKKLQYAVDKKYLRARYLTYNKKPRPLEGCVIGVDWVCWVCMHVVCGCGSW